MREPLRLSHGEAGDDADGEHVAEPVYTVRSDGGIAAKGIHTGAGRGGSDHYGLPMSLPG